MKRELQQILDLPTPELIARGDVLEADWSGILWSGSPDDVINLSALAAIAWEGAGGVQPVERQWSGLNLLCNAAPTPFRLDITHFASVDSFYEAMKVPEGNERIHCAAAPAAEAKRLARHRASTAFSYRGQTIEVNSGAHQQLVAEAIVAKVHQNPLVERALIDTGRARLQFPLTFTGYPNVLGLVTPFVLMAERWKRSLHRP